MFSAASRSRPCTTTAWPRRLESRWTHLSKIVATKGGTSCVTSKRRVLLSSALPLPTDTGVLLAGAQDILSREPSNALSIPTWFVHVSSVIEWVIATQLVVKFAEVKDPVYIRLAYGMLPLHASSLCACTYHFFYNAPELESLVTLQAALTCVGNCTLAGAAFSIYESTKERDGQKAPDDKEEKEKDKDKDKEKRVEVPLQSDDKRNVAGDEDDWSFVSKALLSSFLLGVLIKYGSLLLSLPFHPDIRAASAFVVIPEVALALSIVRQGKRIAQQQGLK